MIVTLIPAAGTSSRMKGRDKLLEEVDGQPILRRTAIEAIEAGLGPVVVSVPPNSPGRRDALRDLDLELVEVADAQKGLSVSLRAGAAWALPRLLKAPDETSFSYHGLIVMLPDMPGPDAADLRAMANLHATRGGPVVRATGEDGRPGHPVLFPLNLVHDFERLHGDSGASEILKGERIVFLPLSGDRASRDLDTPEDWAAWRAENP